MNISVKSWKNLNSVQRSKLLEIAVEQNWMGKFQKGIGLQTAKFASRKG